MSDKPGKRPLDAFRAPILVALLVAAGAALLVQPRVVAAVRADELAALWLLATPVLFAVVVLLAAADSFRTARRRGHFRGPNVVMLAAAVAFLGVLVPRTMSEYRARTSPPADLARIEALATHADPRIRALVMDAVGWRPGPNEDAAVLLERGLRDADPLVVAAAVRAVEHRTGVVIDGADAPARAAAVVREWPRH